MDQTSTLTLNLSLIRTDGGTQPRATIDQNLVGDYAEAMTDGAEFPPVIVFFDGTDYWLADGFHRLHAAIKAERTEIPCEVHQGTRRDAVLFSVGTNATHGLIRTNADKRRAVETLLSDSEWSRWSNREISRRCGVSLDLVNRVRSESSERFVQIENRKATRNGKEYTVNTAKIGSTSKHSAKAQASEHGPETKPAHSLRYTNREEPPDLAAEGYEQPSRQLHEEDTPLDEPETGPSDLPEEGYEKPSVQLDDDLATEQYPPDSPPRVPQSESEADEWAATWARFWKRGNDFLLSVSRRGGITQLARQWPQKRVRAAILNLEKYGKACLKYASELRKEFGS